MVFNSLDFFIFIPIVWLLQMFSGRHRWLTLLVASVFFYAGLSAPYLLLAITIVIGVTYGCALFMDGEAPRAGRRFAVWAGVASNLAILFGMRYFNLLETWINTIIQLHLPTDKHLVTIGVSYYVFQAISYLADVYLGRSKPEHHLGYLALYLGFFPKLLQGPLERAHDLLPQLKQPYQFNYENVRSGMVLFMWGLFKKVTIADRLGGFVDPVFLNIKDYSGIPVLMTVYLYAFQIYFDFSGYTDMALGVARMFNIHLTPNFNSPYLATSIADFWRRWHISFSRWILDYIFTPLQMLWRNHGTAGTALALIITFLASGVWHGSQSGFIVWGLLHGLYLAAGTWYRPYKKRLHKATGLTGTRKLAVWQTLVTFNLVCCAWIFFRAGTLTGGLRILDKIFSSSSKFDTSFYGRGPVEAAILATLLLAMALILIISRHMSLNGFYCSSSFFRWSCYVALVLSTLALYTNSENSFIYLRF